MSQNTDPTQPLPRSGEPVNATESSPSSNPVDLLAAPPTTLGTTSGTITEGSSGMGAFPGRRGETTDSGE